eukprot:gene47540-52617_t
MPSWPEAIRQIRLSGTIAVQRFQERIAFSGLADGLPRKLVRGVGLGKGYALVVKEAPGSVEILIDPAAEDLRAALCGVAQQEPEVVPHKASEGDLTT